MTEQPMSQSTARLAYLDAIRGIAALAVVWGHLYLAFGVDYFRPIMRTPLHLFFDAYAAVTLFFVLSGYVLSVRYLSMQRMGEFNLWGFYIKRYCRIVLPFLAVFALSYLVCIGFYQVFTDNDPVLSKWAQKHWSAAKLELPASEYLKAAVMVLPKTQFPLIPQAWTLRIEMGMSLALPFMVLLACRSSWWLIAFTVIFVELLGLYVFATHFTLGILLAQHQETMVRWVRSNRIYSLLTLVIGIILLTYRWPPEFLAVKLSPKDLRFVTGLGAFLLLLWVMSSPRVQRVMEWPALQFLGRVSYSLYLVHFIVLLTAAQYGIHWANSVGITGSYSYWLAFAITISGSLILAAICYRYVERPAISLGKFLANKASARTMSKGQ